MSGWWLWVSVVWAAPELRLPPEEPPADWEAAARLAGFASGGDADAAGEGMIQVISGDVLWTVVARRGAAERSVQVSPPLDAAAREDLLLLGRSLLRDLETAVPVVIVAPPTPLDPTPWSWSLVVSPMVVGPRLGAGPGAGAELGLELERGSWTAGVAGRTLLPRALRDPGQSWWPVELRGQAGLVGTGQIQPLILVELGMSARSYRSASAGPVALDLKPLAGARAGLASARGPWWGRLTLGLSVDLGPTRVEGPGADYQLGLLESSLIVSFGRVLR